MPNDADRILVGDHVTIYPRGKKRLWTADFWHNGAHRRMSLKTRNKKIALHRALKLDARLASGTYQPPPPPVTVRQAADDYVKYLKTEDRARSTWEKYEGIFKALAAFLENLGAGRMAQFTPTFFDKFRSVRKEGRNQGTLHNEGVIIKQLFKWSKSRDLIAENRVADYPLEKPPREPKEGPSINEVNLILGALEGSDKDAIAVLAITGMRRGELRRLQPIDIDLKGNWVHIRSREGLETKNRYSRKVPIHDRLRLVLEALTNTPRPWLFVNPPSRRHPEGNQPLNVIQLNERVQKVVAGLGLAAGRNQDGFTLHSLRHFFETFTVNAQIPQRAVDTWLGHRSDQSMAAVYYKLKDEESQRFMKQVPFGTGAPAADAGERNGDQ